MAWFIAPDTICDTSGMRAFIAIELPEDVRVALQAFGVRLRERGLDAAWVKPGAMHLTLRFLGDIDEEQAAFIGLRLSRQYEGMAAPRLLARGVGAFPSLRKPSVIWAGVETLAGDLNALHQAAESCARAAGLMAQTKPFHAHLTLARLRARSDRSAFAQALAPYVAPGGIPEFGQELTARNVLLFNSTLTPKGPVYRKVREFTLS